MSQLLIAYFTRPGEERGADGALYTRRVGATAYAASIVERLTDGDAFKIDPAQPLPAGYEACVAAAKAQLDADARPPLAVWPQAAQLQNCRTLILCSPNYFDRLPMPVCSFLAGCDWAGKRILPLITHGGGGAGACRQDVVRLCPGAVVEQALALPAETAASAQLDIQLWLLGQGVPLAAQD